MERPYTPANEDEECKDEKKEPEEPYTPFKPGAAAILSDDDGDNSDDSDSAGGPCNDADYTTNGLMDETSNAFYPGDLEPYPADMPPR